MHVQPAFMNATSSSAYLKLQEGKLGGGSATMANGVCSRRQRKILQSLLLLTLVCGGLYGAMVAYETHKQLKRTEAMALKYQQHQEALSAQLQVVYEHRSRLEKSLQKERMEHKKSKEDFLVYKLEAQQSLNKEKHDGISRYNSLHGHHQMLKTQHEDLKKQYYELQEQHQAQGDDHSKTLDQHRQRYDQLQQVKEVEVSKLKENVYNLREENKQLRKAHQEIHVQLQDTRQQHKDLKSAHDQLVLTLEDHKSALAAAQVQVDEFKKLKESLNKMPILKQPEEPPAAGLQVLPAHIREPEEHQDAKSWLDLQEKKPAKKQNEGVQEEEKNQVRADEDMEEPHKPEEAEQGRDVEQNQPDDNAVEREQHGAIPEHLKSALEQQQEQKRLADQLAEERRQLHLRQEELQRQQLQQQKEREERVKLDREREEQQHKEADLREQQLREEQQRKKAHYENLEAAIVQGEDDARVDLDDETNVHHEEEQRHQEHKQVHHGEQPIEAEVDPADDPNNQGEDEFEEAEQQVHEEENEVPVPPGHPDTHLNRGHQQHPPPEEQLVMAGNPDQQEDNLEEQYQEEGDEEAQDDLAEEQKPEEAGEEEADPYNEENGEQDDAREQEEAGPEEKQPVKHPNEEENYEDEEEEPEEEANHRAEM